MMMSEKTYFLRFSDNQSIQVWAAFQKYNNA